MDKKKKTIVAIVGTVCIILLIVLLKVFVFSSSDSKQRRNQLSISTPKVDKQKINRKSKLEHYEGESIEAIEKNNVVKGLGNIEEVKKQVAFEEPSIIAGEELRNALENNKNVREENNTLETLYTPEPVDDELKQLMQLQEQLLAQSIPQTNQQGSHTEEDDIQKLLESYSQLNQAYLKSPTGEKEGIDISQLTPEKIAEIETSVNEKLAGDIRKKFKEKSYFHGAGSASKQDNVLGLVPAETVDQGILVNGSTIAIRTKKEVRLTNPPVLIPKGAIVYGKVSFGANRLLITINSYKQGNKLYKLKFSLFDFDGVEGIHLGNRTWPKIPAKVTKDVYDYAYQKGTQAATFGGDSAIQLDEAKDIAILSASKEIGNEIFEKRRVFMAKKYHLWFNINTK
ncbi:hypothetical protein A8C32_18125 [Flavivirga aquatica]|uniref:Conjugative transposon TraM C-terminal domain-containing protein n=1 Tax=Flavivirga aquatica TaxID=1849968 RepID=A0A1E5T7J4_9FLAO|nr:conjugative transposon protein TraM [Flavivirga aquatica]OEK07354.1 hypothetical protein A8C32_18125 [Flavivirga aquatica]